MASSTTGRFLRLGGWCLSGGAAKPRWGVDRNQFFGAARPDKHHYGEHPTYNHFLLFLRGIRPTVEEAAASTATVIASAASAVINPTRALVLRHNPDLCLQLVALSSFSAISMYITSCFNDTFQKIVDLTSLLEHRAAAEYDAEGFWRTAAQENERRVSIMQRQQQRLEECWRIAIAKATTSQSFAVLCDHLLPPAESEATDSSQKLEITPHISWRFELLPYGANCSDTQTFPTPGHEMPLRSFSLSFTSNNISGNWGDYINRQDNKNAIMRPSRMMFTDVYIAPTK